MSFKNNTIKPLRVFGTVKTRRTPKQIAVDKKKRFKRDHTAFTMDRNLKYEAMTIKNRLAAEKQLEKGEKGKVPKKLPLLEDMVPCFSLHKTTV